MSTNYLVLPIPGNPLQDVSLNFQKLRSLPGKTKIMRSGPGRVIVSVDSRYLEKFVTPEGLQLFNDPTENTENMVCTGDVIATPGRLRDRTIIKQSLRDSVIDNTTAQRKLVVSSNHREKDIDQNVSVGHKILFNYLNVDDESVESWDDKSIHLVIDYWNIFAILDSDTFDIVECVGGYLEVEKPDENFKLTTGNIILPGKKDKDPQQSLNTSIVKNWGPPLEHGYDWPIKKGQKVIHSSGIHSYRSEKKRYYFIHRSDCQVYID